MELERYRALLCAIEKGSLSAAGEEMGYTPSAISPEAQRFLEFARPYFAELA